ncbi:hypothetical protein [Nostoc sp.]|uniref:hypothetical protein n=1 Tax=Nostoc sp. TaxID=1180 RepID=UPI002FF61ECC
MKRKQRLMWLVLAIATIVLGSLGDSGYTCGCSVSKSTIRIIGKSIARLWAIVFEDFRWQNRI